MSRWKVIRGSTELKFRDKNEGQGGPFKQSKNASVSNVSRLKSPYELVMITKMRVKYIWKKSGFDTPYLKWLRCAELCKWLLENRTEIMLHIEKIKYKIHI